MTKTLSNEAKLPLKLHLEKFTMDEKEQQLPSNDKNLPTFKPLSDFTNIVNKNQVELDV